jgi:hypothetical protein
MYTWRVFFLRLSINEANLFELNSLNQSLGQSHGESNATRYIYKNKYDICPTINIRLGLKNVSCNSVCVLTGV